MGLKKFDLDYRKKRALLIVLSVIILFAVYFFKSASFILRALATLAVLGLFYSIDHFYDIQFKKRHYVFILIIATLSFLASPLYFIYPDYDKIQHFIQPMLTCSLVFYMISKLHLELKWKLAFTFFTVIAILGIFEIGEFALDSLFDLKLQGVFLRDISGIEKFNLLMEPLKDTMIDLIYGVLGVAIYCIGFGISLRKKLHHNIFRED